MPQVKPKPALTALNVSLGDANAGGTPPTRRPQPKSSQKAATNTPTAVARLLAATRRTLITLPSQLRGHPDLNVAGLVATV
jgi:hypothetical protein